MSDNELFTKFKNTLAGLYGIVGLFSSLLFFYHLKKNKNEKKLFMFFLIFASALTRLVLNAIPISVYNKIEKHVFLQMVIF